MTSITFAQMVNAVEETLGVASSLVDSQSYNELTEGIIDTPMLQVYWESAFQDPSGGSAQSSFKSIIRQTHIVIRADLYAAQSSDLAEDMEKTIDVTEEIITILEEQLSRPFFGLEGIKAFSWTVSRANFTYGDQQTLFMGSRVDISLRVW